VLVSINPASDIVLDVARAADPSRYAAATNRLARLAEVDPAGAGDFAAILDAERTSPDVVDPSLILGRNAEPKVKPRSDARIAAVKDLEQLVLQKLVETMLPEETSTLFGRGTAGDVWRSMLAEQLAAQIGSGIDLGVGKAMPWLAGQKLAAVAKADRAGDHGEISGVRTDGES
jgi:flagellar protein FlgJ